MSSHICESSFPFESSGAMEALAKVREPDNVANKAPAGRLMLDRLRGAAAVRAGGMRLP
jgi:hypothetical protein